MFSIRESSSSRKTARNWREKGDGRKEDDKGWRGLGEEEERWEDTTSSSVPWTAGWSVVRTLSGLGWIVGGGVCPEARRVSAQS